MKTREFREEVEFIKKVVPARHRERVAMFLSDVTRKLGVASEDYECTPWKGGLMGLENGYAVHMEGYAYHGEQIFWGAYDSWHKTKQAALARVQEINNL